MGVVEEYLEFEDGGRWEAWLADHHRTRNDAWLRIAKKHSAVPLLGIDAALDGALCFGWIDGQRRGLDADSFLQRYSRRRPSSTWSQVNVAKVDALVAAGRMRPAGTAEVERAVADGRWAAAYERQATAQCPPELALELTADPRADAVFRSWGRSEQYALYLPVLRAVGTPARRRAIATALQTLRDAEPGGTKPGDEAMQSDLAERGSRDS